MKKYIPNLITALVILIALNLIGYLYHKNYDGAVVGSCVGTLIGMILASIKVRRTTDN